VTENRVAAPAAAVVPATRTRRPARRLSLSVPAAYGDEWTQLRIVNGNLTDSQLLVRLMIEAKTCKTPAYMELL
jgi:hypothetical protein